MTRALIPLLGSCPEELQYMSAWKPACGGAKLRLDYRDLACAKAAANASDSNERARRVVQLLTNRKVRDANFRGAVLALASYEGASRGEAARIGGVTVQIVRDWVVKFNAHGPAGLIDRKAPGPTSRLTTEHRKALAELIETGPTPAIHRVVRWRLVDLCQWDWEEFRVRVAKQTMSRDLRAMGYRKLSARPRHHAQASGAIDAFKKPSQRAWRKSRTTRASPSTT